MTTVFFSVMGVVMSAILIVAGLTYYSGDVPGTTTEADRYQERLQSLVEAASRFADATGTPPRVVADVVVPGSAGRLRMSGAASDDDLGDVALKPGEGFDVAYAVGGDRPFVCLSVPASPGAIASAAIVGDRLSAVVSGACASAPAVAPVRDRVVMGVRIG